MDRIGQLPLTVEESNEAYRQLRFTDWGRADALTAARSWLPNERVAWVFCHVAHGWTVGHKRPKADRIAPDTTVYRFASIDN
jgi:hypothetical protein